MRVFVLFFLILLLPINIYAQCSTDRGCDSGYEAGCYFKNSNSSCTTVNCVDNTEPTILWCDDGKYCPNNSYDPNGCPGLFGAGDNIACDDITDCRLDVNCPNAGSACAAFCNNDGCATQTVKCKEDDAYVENSSYYLDSNGNCQQYGDLWCSDFSGCSGTVDGNAIHVDSGQYDVSACRCTEPEQSMLDSNGDSYSYTKKLKANGAQVLFGETINYNEFVSGTYHYTSCSDGKYLVAEASIKTINRDSYSCETNCACETAMAGYYVENYELHSCPAGKTSPDGANLVDACHYTSDTRFCDATGRCVSGLNLN